MMNQVIWKFPLDVADRQIIQMPKDATILTVQVQDHQLCLWAIVDPKQKAEARIIEIHGTGNFSLDPRVERRYINTIQTPPYVWHVFERLTSNHKAEG